MEVDRQNKFLELYWKILHERYSVGICNELDEVLYNLLLELENAIANGCEGTLFTPEEMYNYIRAEYLSKLLVLFPRLIKNNLQDKVFTACVLFTHIRENRSYIPDALESFFFPQDAYIKDKRNYYSIWDDIMSQYIEEIDTEEFKKYYRGINEYAKSLLDMYNIQSEEYASYPNNWHQCHESNKFIKLVMAYFYKEGYDIELFPKAYEYTYNNALDIEEYYKLNTPDTHEEDPEPDIIDFDESIISRIINGAMGNNRIIR